MLILKKDQREQLQQVCNKYSKKYSNAIELYQRMIKTSEEDEKNLVEELCDSIDADIETVYIGASDEFWDDISDLLDIAMVQRNAGFLEKIYTFDESIVNMLRVNRLDDEHYVENTDNNGYTWRYKTDTGYIQYLFMEDGYGFYIENYIDGILKHVTMSQALRLRGIL